MPNRKTFDDREKVDHSGHSTRTAEKGDLAATPDSPPGNAAPSPPPAGAAAAEPGERARGGSSHTLHVKRRPHPR
jgi:hypothetical protein